MASLQKHFGLTNKEYNALIALNDCNEGADLAERLGISVNSADECVRNLLNKMHVPHVRFLKNISHAANNSTVALPHYVVCKICNEHRPLAWFPQWPFQETCTDCLNGFENKLAETKRLERAKEVFASLMSETRAVRVSVPQVQEFLAQAYEDFGGVPKFTRLLTDQIKMACELRPGTKSTIDALMTLVKLNLEVNKFDADLDERKMSDDELKEQLWSIVQAKMNEGMLDEAKRQVYEEFMQPDNLVTVDEDE